MKSIKLMLLVFLLLGLPTAQADAPKGSECLMHVDMKHDKEDMHKGNAHDIHRGLYGGAFFMAPDKTHHIEGVYSKRCGFSLVIYGAYTNPINVRQFHAFIQYIPEDEDQLEAIRFLSPTKDGSLLKAPSVEMEGPYEIELYLKFPNNEEPALFNFSANGQEVEKW